MQIQQKKEEKTFAAPWLMLYCWTRASTTHLTHNLWPALVRGYRTCTTLPAGAGWRLHHGKETYARGEGTYRMLGSVS